MAENSQGGKVEQNSENLMEWSLGDATPWNRRYRRAGGSGDELLKTLQKDEPKPLPKVTGPLQYEETRSPKQRDRMAYLRDVSRASMCNGKYSEAMKSLGMLLHLDCDDIECRLLLAECTIYENKDIDRKSFHDTLVKSAAYSCEDLFRWATQIVKSDCQRVGWLIILDSLREKKEFVGEDRAQHTLWLVALACTVGWLGYHSISPKKQPRNEKMLIFALAVLCRIGDSLKGPGEGLMKTIVKSILKLAEKMLLAASDGLKAEDLKEFGKSAKKYRKKLKDDAERAMYCTFVTSLGFIYSELQKKNMAAGRTMPGDGKKTIDAGREAINHASDGLHLAKAIAHRRETPLLKAICGVACDIVNEGIQMKMCLDT